MSQKGPKYLCSKKSPYPHFFGFWDLSPDPIGLLGDFDSKGWGFCNRNY